MLGRIDDHPEILALAIEAIRASLPELSPETSLVLCIQNTLLAQDAVAATMGSLLESLASHYEQMYTALKETEDGEPFDDEDLLRAMFCLKPKSISGY